MSDLVIASADQEQDGVRRLETVDTLQPGYYWRVTSPFVTEPDGWGYPKKLHAGDVHLLLDVIEFDSAAQRQPAVQNYTLRDE